ncbi:unnamed protein product [Oikopleura dioica]|uniref:Uncharacterized protein n=1 Tax=Oikopleura dioica TaxID=34765 RepID=E4YIX6_OIKDI|nr:unnamed protein product [Oikopleura dioica]
MRNLCLFAVLINAENNADDRLMYIMTGPKRRNPCYLKTKIETSAGGIFFAEKRCAVQVGNIVLEKNSGSDFSDIFGQVKRIRPLKMRLEVEIHVKALNSDQLYKFIQKKEPIFDDFYEERFSAENIGDVEMHANYDGKSLDDFNDLDDFDQEQVFGDDEDYDVIFGNDDEEIFSIYGRNGGIVGARLAKKENMKSIGGAWVPALFLIGAIVSVAILFKKFVSKEVSNANSKY